VKLDSYGKNAHGPLTVATQPLDNILHVYFNALVLWSHSCHRAL